MLLAAGKMSALRVAKLSPTSLHYVKRLPELQAFHMSASTQNYIAAAPTPTIPIKFNSTAESCRFPTQQRFHEQMSTAILAQAAPLSARALHSSARAQQWMPFDPKFTIESNDTAFSPARRSYSTQSEAKQPPISSTTTTTSSSSTSTSSSSATSSSSTSSSDGQTGDKLSKKEQLKRAFKDYGATIVAFHVGISLISLAGFYALVSSGINLVPVLEWLGISSSAIAEKVATGSTFVVAYAVHKVFAPARISITLGSTPFIVRYLRSKGFMKAKPQSK